MLIKNKKGIDFLTGHIVFIIITVLFVSLMFLFLTNAGKSNSFIEEVYAKKICLVMDSLKPGTEIKMYMPELFDYAEKNNYKPQNMIVQNSVSGKITLRVAEGRGFTYSYFGKIISITLDIPNKNIILKS